VIKKKGGQMKNTLLLKIIAVVIVLIGVGFGIYKSITKEKDLVFEATIKDVVSRDNKYTILVEKKDKDNVIEYEFEIDNKTKIIYENKEVTLDKLKANQQVSITAEDVMMPSEPAKLANVKKIVILKD
jgi:uncharacterized protein (UPF0333 family)